VLNLLRRARLRFPVAQLARPHSVKLCDSGRKFGESLQHTRCMAKESIKPELRKNALDQRRHQKMAESAHAYVRGNTVQFYEWLESDAVPKSIPMGPPVWICGDCHTGNLGPVADLEGNVEIQIRDLDQTVIGNPAHDLLRLGLSLAMAARSSDLPGITTALMIEVMIDGYREALSGREGKIDPDQIAPIEKVMRSALKRKWRHLAEERIEDVTPHIPLGTKFWPLSQDERKELKLLFEDEKERELLRCLTRSKKKDSIELVDAAYWMKGCSSLGRLRFAALVRAGRKYRLIDIKEASAAAAPRSKGTKMPANNAERVVTGARQISPFLGERMVATALGGRQVVVRELRPQDIKFELSALTKREAILTAKLFAGVVGKAHGRQMSRKIRSSWSKELMTGHTKSLDAPSWLWNSVVDLVAKHEATYLKHCRLFALTPPIAK
jgi:uncharacterized protein (DUF2252 family)